MNVSERFREFFRNEELVLALKRAFEKSIANQGEFSDRNLIDRIVQGRGYVASGEELGDVDDLRELIEPIFDDFIVARIGQPAPVTSYELALIAIAQPTGCDWDTPNADGPIGYKRMVAFALAELESERESQRSIFLARGIHQPGRELPMFPPRMTYVHCPRAFAYAPTSNLTMV